MTQPLRVFAQRRTYGEALWAVLALVVGCAGFAFTAASLFAGGLLVVTFVGLPLFALAGLVSRAAGQALRRTANTLIGTDVPAAQPFRPTPGLLGWLGACLTDGTAWRARLYLVLKLPLGVLSSVVTVGFYGYGLASLSYALWRPALPCNGGFGCHRGAQLGDNRTLDSVPEIVLVTVIGLAMLLLAPWAVKATLLPDRALLRRLLGPTARGDRVAQLERTRAAAVDDSAATLRRIERDLHDGAQAKLVSVAMTVGRAREKVTRDPDAASALLADAHATAKQAIVELRDLARGIHPPVLDAGLDQALATLAAHSAVPARVHASGGERPAPAIETMAYFCAAELLANAGKHSGATSVDITLRSGRGRLCLVVRDDGRGGARLGAGSGLTGLADRIATVDGTLTVDSPEGGPTTVTVDVPLRSTEES